MNLIVLVAWYVVIVPHTASVPRHQLKKYSAKKSQNSYRDSHDPTALEVLERKFVHPNKSHIKKNSHIKRRLNHLENVLESTFPFRSTTASISVKNVFRALNTDRAIFESCFASFGDQSPLCKTQKILRKPRHSNLLFLHKKHIESEKGFEPNPSTNEDFFGLFKTYCTVPGTISSKIPIHKRIAPSVSIISPISSSPLSPTNITTNSWTVFNFSSQTIPATLIANQTATELMVISNNFSSTFEGNQSFTTPTAMVETVNSTTPQITSQSVLQNYTTTPNQLQTYYKLLQTNKPPVNVTTLHIVSHMLYVNHTQKQDNEQVPANSQINRNMLYFNHPADEQESRNRLAKIDENDNENSLAENEEEEQSTEANSEEISTEVEETSSEETSTEETSPEEISVEDTSTGEIPTSDLEHEKPNHTKEHSVLDSPGGYSREECEKDNQRTCICSFENLKNDFTKIFSLAKSTKLVMDEISHYECRQFIPVPSQFILSSNEKATALSTNHKPMTVDSEKGPKEIDEKSMDEFIAQSVSEEDDLTHVFVNTDVEISCFPTNDIHLSPSEADHVSYKWTFGNKKAITEGRILENADGEGSLSITEVTAGDSENYTCEVEYINPDTGQHTEETFEHVLNVVALPIVTVRLSLHYRGSVTCSPSVMQMFKMYMPLQLQDSVCKISDDKYLCKVEVHSTVCHTESRERGERRTRIKKLIWPRTKREDSMEMSLNYEVFVHRSEEKLLSAENSTLCHAECHLYITFKLLRLLKESLTGLMSIPVASETQHGTEDFHPVQSSFKLKYIFGCMGGYHLRDGFCVACPEHTFSNDGDTECTPCPPHTYQGKLGARKCVPCTNQWIPACNEYIENTNIYIVLLVLVILFITIAVFSCIYYMRVKEKTFSHMTHKVVPFSAKTFTQRSKGAKKSSKRVKISEPETTEIQSLLDSTTDDEISGIKGKSIKKRPPLSSDDEVVGKKNVSGKRKKVENSEQNISLKQSKATKKR